MSEIHLLPVSAPVAVERPQPTIASPLSPQAAAPEAAAEIAPAAQHPTVQTNFAYDLDLRQIIITLRREETGETITQIPSEIAQHYTAQTREALENSLDSRG